MRIGEFATRSGVPVPALRRMETAGLLVPIRRDDNGYRRYAAAQVPLARRYHLLGEAGLPAALVRDLVRALEGPNPGTATATRGRAALAAYLTALDAQPQEPMLDLDLDLVPPEASARPRARRRRPNG